MKNIELYINDQEVILPADFNITYIETNRTINKSMDHTYDFDISLEHWKNAEIFGYLFRKNKVNFPDNMPAKLHIDYKEINGIVIVLSNSDREVKCQFVSKSSTYDKLMYSKVYELDWGEAAPHTATDSPFDQQYYQKGVCERIFPHVACDISDVENVESSELSEGKCLLNRGPKYVSKLYCMQPYLMYYVNKIADIFGYKLQSNVLDNDEFAKRIYIANTVFSYKYADKLPDWTLSEFIAEIEKFFNVSVLIDNNNKTVDIVSVDSLFDNKALANDAVDIDDIVFDSYMREFGNAVDKTDNRFETQHIEFEKQDSDLFYQNHMLSEEFLSECEIEEFATSREMLTQVQSLALSNIAIENIPKIIYRDKSSGQDYFFWKRNYTDEDAEINYKMANLCVGKFTIFNGYCLIAINKLRQTGVRNDSTISLKIIPAPMRALLYNVGVADVYQVYHIPAPINRYKLNKTKPFVATLYGESRTKPTGKVLEVALYAGWESGCRIYRRDLVSVSEQFGAASHLSYIDMHSEFGYNAGNLVHRTTSLPMASNFVTWYRDVYYPATKDFSLTPNYIKSNFYKRSLSNENIYTFTIRHDRRLNCRQVYRYDGGYYIPISLEWKTGTDMVKGRFYKIM